MYISWFNIFGMSIDLETYNCNCYNEPGARSPEPNLSMFSDIFRWRWSGTMKVWHFHKEMCKCHPAWLKTTVERLIPLTINSKHKAKTFIDTRNVASKSLRVALVKHWTTFLQKYFNTHSNVQMMIVILYIVMLKRSSKIQMGLVHSWPHTLVK